MYNWLIIFEVRKLDDDLIELDGDPFICCNNIHIILLNIFWYLRHTSYRTLPYRISYYLMFISAYKMFSNVIAVTN